ncbi:N-acyl-aromatic-L-amino acid amidohydrolase (carboxylate-forming)-like, partial [Stegostoma tigrinum]|uniref:N-acyl-aromatic-L-amino acid amidohydrolase (carboxylate-forming)-like n=1 Tax=Stegostoma tigrinum TaxID=3053191 RepID=UPI00286FFFC3
MTSPSIVTFAPVRRVAVLGGVHGNEMSGIFLTRHWLQDPAELQRSTFSVMPLMANQLAVEQCVRYIHKDLNRCFLPENLNSELDPSLPHEIVRAKELNELLGPRGSDTAVDLVIDLHNTTANMGDCLMINNSSDHFNTHLAAYIQVPRVGSLILSLTPYLTEYSEMSPSLSPSEIQRGLGRKPQGRSAVETEVKKLSINSKADPR